MQRLYQRHAGEYAMKSDEKGKRSCLKCDKIFITEGAHHRICSDCTVSNLYQNITWISNINNEDDTYDNDNTKQR